MAFEIPKLRRCETAPFEFSFGGHSVVLHTRLLGLETREVANFAFNEIKTTRAEPADKYEERMSARERDMEILARCCVASWERVTRTASGWGIADAGDPLADCTPENVLAFLRWLDSVGYREEVSAYLRWAQNPLNFREPLVEASKVGEG